MAYYQKIKQSGFTLVEVLVALFIIAVGILGVMGLQLSTLQANQSASHRSQAVWAASDILDRMRANRTAATDGDYNITIDTATPSDTSTVANADLNEWLTRLGNWLPEGDGAIAYNAVTEQVTVTIQWNESKMQGGDEEQQFVFTSQI